MFVARLHCDGTDLSLFHQLCVDIALRYVHASQENIKDLGFIIRNLRTFPLFFICIFVAKFVKVFFKQAQIDSENFKSNYSYLYGI